MHGQQNIKMYVYVTTLEKHKKAVSALRLRWQ